MVDERPRDCSNRLQCRGLSPCGWKPVNQASFQLPTPFLDCLSAHVAILDGSGMILWVNRAWKEYGQANGYHGPEGAVGLNYLEECRRAVWRGDQTAQSVHDALQSLLKTGSGEVRIPYDCHSPDRKRWFMLRAFPLQGDPLTRAVVVAHEDVTELMLAREELQEQRAKLEQMNLVLRELLDRREQDQKALKEAVAENVNRRLIPLAESLRAHLKTQPAGTLLDRLEQGLREIASPFVRRLGLSARGLTARELEVAELIRNGHSSKEIAQMLHISEKAVAFHRGNLRRKLGLKNRRESLRVRLLALERPE